MKRLLALSILATWGCRPNVLTLTMVNGRIAGGVVNYGIEGNPTNLPAHRTGAEMRISRLCDGRPSKVVAEWERFDDSLGERAHFMQFTCE